jgi:predicted ABC-class ATPase
VDDYRLQAARQGIFNKCIAASELYQRIADKGLLPAIEKEVNQDAQPLNPSKKSLVRLWVRMTATLDMILKDTASHVLVRKGNKKDFIAALHLLEKVTLPLYYKIYCKEPLFADYDAVEPVLPWEVMSK